MLEEVRRNWYNLIPEEARSPLFKQGKLAIQFVIDKNGIIQHIKEGNEAIDPASAEDTCNILTHKKASP